jgi:hypothetical protein
MATAMRRKKRAAKRKAPVFYDCVASCGGGLPIEIGWAFADPATGEIRSESHLVKPPADWDLGPDWDADAQMLHKITTDQLYITRTAARRSRSRTG